MYTVRFLPRRSLVLVPCGGLQAIHITSHNDLWHMSKKPVTTWIDGVKRKELTRLGTNRLLLKDKPEKRHLRQNLEERSSCLNAATRQLNIVIKKAVRKQNADVFHEAWALFESMKSTLELDGPLYDAVLNLCAKAAWHHKGVSVWMEMPEECKSIVSYSTMIDLCAKCKKVEMAEELMAAMRKRGIQPNIITYVNLIKAFSMTSQPERALQTFAEVKSTDIFLQATDTQTRQTVYQVVMVAVARSGDYSVCRELFMEMEAKGIPAEKTHYTALMMSCAQAPHADIAQQIFDRMLAAKIEPDVACYTILMSCARHDLAHCKKIQSSMPTKPSALTYQELLKAHVLACDGVGAREVIQLATSEHKVVGGSKWKGLVAQAQRLP